MTSTRRPFYRRKRWLAAGLLWLAICYPLSIGPAVYCGLRGLLPLPAYQVIYSPLFPAFRWLDPTETGQGIAGRYVTWWADLAHGHDGPG